MTVLRALAHRLRASLSRSRDDGDLQQDIDAHLDLLVSEHEQRGLSPTALGMLLGAVALLLAAIGLHGLVAYGVARRTREIGLRMALGARRQSVVWTMARHALASVALGVLAGIPIALLAGRGLAGMLFEVTPYDPLAITAASAILVVTAIGSTYLPARRASRVDPMIALRAE